MIRFFPWAMLGTLTLVGLLGSFSSRRGITQAAAPPLDPSPFSRPHSLCTIAGTEPQEALSKIIEKVKAEKFSIDEIDPGEGYFTASRTDNAPASSGAVNERVDKLIGWIERDLNHPTDHFKVFLIYGRYEKVWAGTLEMRRILVNDTYETGKVGTLKQHLVAMALDK